MTTFIPEKAMKDYLEVYHWGISKDIALSDQQADAIASLIAYATTHQEIKASVKRRWEELGLIKDGLVDLTDEEMEGDGISWILLAMAYTGELERTIKNEIPYYKSTAFGVLKATELLSRKKGDKTGDQRQSA